MCIRLWPSARCLACGLFMSLHQAVSSKGQRTTCMERELVWVQRRGPNLGSKVYGGLDALGLLSLVHLTHPHSPAFIHAQTTSKQANRVAQSHQETYVCLWPSARCLVCGLFLSLHQAVSSKGQRTTHMKCELVWVQRGPNLGSKVYGPDALGLLSLVHLTYPRSTAFIHAQNTSKKCIPTQPWF